MRAITISAKGQIAIPKDIRDSLGIKAGDKFTVEIKNKAIELKPAITLTIPKEQAYFWTSEIQKKIRVSKGEFEEGNHKEYTVDDLIEELDKRDKNERSHH
jgi:AbrB family looped-hinge helix DNA binding protein